MPYVANTEDNQNSNTEMQTVDPDETARYEPSHLDIHCLQKIRFAYMTERVKAKGYALVKPVLRPPPLIEPCSSFTADRFKAVLQLVALRFFSITKLCSPGLDIN